MISRPMTQEDDIPKLHCLVCGSPMGSASELSSHMSETHKVGIDYFRCKECATIVRNLDLHMASAHGSALPPASEQRRVKAKDWNLTRKRSRGRKKPKFKSGLFFSKKMMRNLWFRSGWERNVYAILERCPQVHAYIPEPYPITYSYSGEVRSYWPDILVQLRDGSRLLVEVKPKAQTKLKVNKAKWEAAEAHCQRNSTTFRVWTEGAITRLSSIAPDSLTKEILLS